MRLVYRVLGWLALVKSWRSVRTAVTYQARKRGRRELRRIK